MLRDTQRYAMYFVAWLVIAGLAWLLGPVLSPFAGAAIFACMCVPLVDRLARGKVLGSVGVLPVVPLAALFLVLMHRYPDSGFYRE